MALNLPSDKAVIIIFGADATGDNAEAESRAVAALAPALRDVVRVKDPTTLTPAEASIYYTPYKDKRSIATASGGVWDSLADAESVVHIYIQEAFLNAQGHIQ